MASRASADAAVAVFGEAGEGDELGEAVVGGAGFEAVE